LAQEISRMTVDEIGQKITAVLQAKGVEYAALFGSAARGEARSDSDVDIIVRYAKSPGLLEHIGLAQELEDALHAKVDLVTESSVSRSLAATVKKDMRILYGQPQRPDLC
jgi:predicted nucleotidyltransferase